MKQSEIFSKRHGACLASLPITFLLSTTLGVGCGGGAQQFAAVGGKAVPGKEGDAKAGQDAPAQRKIIYNAKLELLVDDLEHAEVQVNRFVQEQGGYIAKSEMHGSPGSPRNGTWTIRVPVDHFRAAMDAAGKLGELRSSNVDSDDISDKYYDLKAHLKNDETEEEGLRKLLLEKTNTGKLEDLLAVRREIRTIRGEIDRQQGQLHRWDKETALATIVLNVQSRKDYTPPAPTGFWPSVGRTFESSVEALKDFGIWLALVIVALAPWLPLIALVIAPIWLRLRRRKARATK